MKKSFRILSVLIIFIFLAGTASQNSIAQTTWTVDDDGPADFLFIQAAINFASPGDTVSVLAGTYSPSTNGEVFPIKMKDRVSLIGAGADVCILNSGGTTRVIICLGISDPTTKIKGFTITNGSASTGGGIGCWSSSVPTITNNVITGNRAGYYGGGIYCYYSNPTIMNNIITGNRTLSNHGGGICCWNQSHPNITNNIISGNMAYSHGGGLSCLYSNPTIANNVITGNSCQLSGGRGGGIYLEDNCHPIVTNNIITGNSATRGGGISCWFASCSHSTYNNVWGNPGGDYYGSCCYPGAGCISDDPLFVDPASDDYHLKPGSPCIDSGDNSAPGLPAFDFDGNPRIIDGNNDGIDVVDMGAYELTNQPPVAVCKDIEIPTNENCEASIVAEDVDGGSYDPDEGDTITLSVDNLGPFPLGENYVNLTVTDENEASATCQAVVTVVDTTPPNIEGLSASPNVLWPPNHKMVSVNLSISVTDHCDPAPICQIIQVTSNEPEDGLGNGDKAPDWEITGNLTVKLRAERSGTGSGRIYTITVVCTDADGNSSTETVNVTVPHNM